MIYVDDDGPTVDSIITCSDTESANAGHSSQEDPPLGQPLQTYTDSNEHTNNADDEQDQKTEKYFCIHEKPEKTTGGNPKKDGQRKGSQKRWPRDKHHSRC